MKVLFAWRGTRLLYFREFLKFRFDNFSVDMYMIIYCSSS